MLFVVACRWLWLGIVVVCCWLLLLLFAIGYVVFAVGYGCLLVVIVVVCSWLLMLFAAGYRRGLWLVTVVCCYCRCLMFR